MYVQVKNENYGYAVSTFGEFVAIGNPGIERYAANTSSKYWSGSVDVFLYNKGIDEHVYVGSLYKDQGIGDFILSAETGSPQSGGFITGSLVSASLRTEPSGSDLYTLNRDLRVNTGIYSRMLEDGYGVALDIYDKQLVVGCPYYFQQTVLSSSTTNITGSTVDIFDLNKYKNDSFNTILSSDVQASINLGTGSKSGFVHLYTGNSPSGYNIVDVFYSSTANGSYTQNVARADAPFSGGFTEIYIRQSALPSFGFFKFRFTLNPNPYVMSITDPDQTSTGSFGKAVSINDGWIAIGSPYSGSNGAVYLYKNDSTTSQLSWSYQQKIESNDPIPGLLFGSSIELNKVTGSRSGSIIVGVGNISGSKSFLFEYISGSWSKTYTFAPETTSSQLTFGNYNSYTASFTTASEYGTAVSMYNNTVVIGSPKNRTVKEYALSSTYNQGAVYVYDKCENTTPLNYNLSLKTFGDDTIMKNNRLGHSVSIYGNNIVAGIPKTNANTLTTCDVQSTLNQLHYCDSSLENTLNGQSLFLQRNTSSLDWGISKIYRRKKRYLSPYKSYGWAVDIADFSMVVGSPMKMANINRDIDIYTTQTLDVELEDLAGKSYIYNLPNLKSEFHVGNVFYRNGKIILMTSGSIFDGLMFNPISQYEYEYDLQLKSKHTIYEKQTICTVNPGEFNVSTNPTAITRNASSFDINGNGYVDFQDVDVLLSYMQYKNTQLYGSGTITTNWSSSIVTKDDEQSLLRYYKSAYDTSHTDILISESISRYEFADTSIQTTLDFNQDNRIDTNDINILWKYFTNRLTQENYTSYITPSCIRRLFSDIMDHMDNLIKRTSVPVIKSGFFDYERLSASDKTGSYLAPMVTTIGLYNGLDLVAVSKLGAPIKITPEFPINFIVKMDF